MFIYIYKNPISSALYKNRVAKNMFFKDQSCEFYWVL